MHTHTRSTETCVFVCCVCTRIIEYIGISLISILDLLLSPQTLTAFCSAVLSSTMILAAVVDGLELSNCLVDELDE